MSGEGIVNTALLPVFAERDVLQIRTDELLYGMSVEITDTKERDRYRIETDYQYTGLVSSGGVLCEGRRVGVWKRSKLLVVSGRFCDVLSQPTVKSRVLLTLYRGSLLQNRGSAAEPGWHCVGLADGTDGYVRQEQVREYVKPFGGKVKNQNCPEECGNTGKKAYGTEAYGREAGGREAGGIEAYGTESALRDALVNTAYSYLGTPYRWGGKSTLGIDCSGFTFMVYALNGIYIHRDSAWLPQSLVRKIADCEKKAGDLLYFPGHIAMYLGNGEYIHATARDGAGVTVNSLKKGCAGYRADLEHSYLYAGTVF